ncbi:MAG: LytR/AlgR family response regulator transcription factor [Bernardetiaceae bacterium]
MKNEQIWIVEDDRVIGKDLQLSLRQMGYQVPEVFVSGEDFLSRLGEDLPDIVLLDINLAGQLDGIQVGQQLQDHFGIPFIYLTALTGKPILERAKITEPYAYLVKPFKIEDVERSLELALYKQRHKKTRPTAEAAPTLLLKDHLFVKSKNRLEKLAFQDILWIEAKDIYAALHTARGNFVVSHSLKELTQILPIKDFIRVHRSFMAALDKIEAIEDNNLIIRDAYIPIGKTYRESLLKRLQII